MPSLSQVLNGGRRPGSSASMPTMRLPPATGLVLSTVVPVFPPALLLFLLLPHAVATKANVATTAKMRMAGRPFCPRILRSLTALSPPVRYVDSVDWADRHSATPPPYSPNGEESTVTQT